MQQMLVVVAGFMLVKQLMGHPLTLLELPWWGVALSAGGYVLLAILGGRSLVQLLLRRLMRGRAVRRAPMVLITVLQAYLLGGQVGLMLLGWGNLFYHHLRLGRTPLLPDLLAMLPFVLALLGVWWTVFPLELALRERVRMELVLAGAPGAGWWTRRQYWWFSVRHHLLFVAIPASAIILLLDVLRIFGQDLPEAAQVAIASAGGGSVVLLAPWLIALVWDTRALPAGALRERLEALCRRVGLTCRDILVWNTSSVVVNAGVMGIIRPARYVLLSDGLLGQMQPEELEVILGHEAGHVVARHIPYLAAFTLGLLGVVTSAWDLAAQELGAASIWADPTGIVAAMALWLWLFGFVSRRFERQSDVYAAWSVVRTVDPGAEGLPPEGVALFAQALRKVARLNGIDPGAPNFRHGSIAGRIGYLHGLCQSGLGWRHECRAVRRLKIGIWLLLAAGVTVSAWAASLPP